MVGRRKPCRRDLPFIESRARAREFGHEAVEVLDRRNHFGIRQLKTIPGRSCEAHRGITLTTFTRNRAWLSRG